MQSLREDSKKKQKNHVFTRLSSVLCSPLRTVEAGREFGKKGRERHLARACACLCVWRTRTRIYIHSCAYTKPFPHYPLLCKLKNKKRITANLTWASFSPRRYEGTLNVVSFGGMSKKKKDELFCTALKLVISCFHIQRGRDKSLSRSSSRVCTVYIV